MTPGGALMTSAVMPQSVGVEGAYAPVRPRGAAVIVALAIIGSLYPQRFVLPAPRLSVTFLILIVLVAAALLLNIGVIQRGRAIVAACLTAVATAAAVCAAIWTPFLPSLESLLILLLAWAPLAVLMRAAPGAPPLPWDRIFLWCALPAAFAVLVQAGLQFTPVGWLDPVMELPPTVRYEKIEYAVTYEYVWGTGIYKPNGFFFLEPSFASQYMALGALAALSFRPAWAILFVAALASTASGTGIVALAVGLPFAFLRASATLRLFILAIGGGAVVVLLSSPLGALLTERAGELSDDSSSGSMRFVDPFVVLGQAASAFPALPITGLGPSTGDEVSVSLGAERANLSILPKASVEYGLFFAVPFVIAVVCAIALARAVTMANRVALTAMILVLSGALLQGPTSLLLWSAVFAAPGRRAGTRVPGATRPAAFVGTAAPRASSADTPRSARRVRRRYRAASEGAVTPGTASGA